MPNLRLTVMSAACLIGFSVLPAHGQEKTRDAETTAGVATITFATEKEFELAEMDEQRGGPVGDAADARDAVPEKEQAGEETMAESRQMSVRRSGSSRSGRSIWS